MRKSRYTKAQMILILKEVEKGRLVKDVCSEFGLSAATFYNWKSKYNGNSKNDHIEFSDIIKLKDLEEENRRLKQMYANVSLEYAVLKDMMEKKL